MFCTNCGASVQDDAAFCGNCGAAVSREQSGNSQSYGGYSQQTQSYSQQTQSYSTGAASPSFGTANTVLGFCCHPLVMLTALLYSVLAIWRLVDFFKWLSNSSRVFEMLESSHMDGGLRIAMIAEIIGVFLLPIASVAMAIGAWSVIIGGQNGSYLLAKNGCKTLVGGIGTRLTVVGLTYFSLFVTFCYNMGQVSKYGGSSEAEGGLISYFIGVTIGMALVVATYASLSGLVKKLKYNIDTVQVEGHAENIYCTGGYPTAVLFVISIVPSLLGTTEFKLEGYMLAQTIITLVAFLLIAGIAVMFNTTMTAIKYRQK